MDPALKSESAAPSAHRLLNALASSASFECPRCDAPFALEELEPHFRQRHLGERLCCALCRQIVDEALTEVHFSFFHAERSGPETTTTFQPEPDVATYCDGLMYCGGCGAVVSPQGFLRHLALENRGMTPLGSYYRLLSMERPEAPPASFSAFAFLPSPPQSLESKLKSETDVETIPSVDSTPASPLKKQEIEDEALENLAEEEAETEEASDSDVETIPAVDSPFVRDEDVFATPSGACPFCGRTGLLTTPLYSHLVKEHFPEERHNACPFCLYYFPTGKSAVEHLMVKHLYVDEQKLDEVQ